MQQVLLTLLGLTWGSPNKLLKDFNLLAIYLLNFFLNFKEYFHELINPALDFKEKRDDQNPWQHDNANTHPREVWRKVHFILNVFLLDLDVEICKSIQLIVQILISVLNYKVHLSFNHRCSLNVYHRNIEVN